MASARTALDDTAAMRGKDPLTALNIKALREEIAHYCALGARVIDQARRRVLDGEQVPTSEKIYSIFEPHTDLIKRGKVRTPVEFGHKVFLAESARGLITQYEVLKGNPVDEVHVAPSLRRHRRIFRRSPALYGADRGFFSESNVAVCARGGVAMVEHSAARRPQDAATPGLRTIAGVQARPALPCRHRGAHLGVDARPRHEALPRRRRRALRAVCRRRGARQQSHDHRRTVDQTLQTPPQNQPTIPQLTGDAVKQTAVLIATPRTTAPRRGRPVPKMAREALANSPAR